MPCEVFDRWKLFYWRNPFDPESMSALPAAAISATLINLHRAPGKPAVSVRDLLPRRVAASPDPTPETLDAKIKARFAALMKNPPPEPIE